MPDDQLPPPPHRQPAGRHHHRADAVQRAIHRTRPAPINRIGALLSVAGRRDRGVELRILRKDKRGTHTAADARELLARYGVRAHRGRFDATYQYIIVGRRQANWTRYLLKRAAVATDTIGSQASAAGRMPKPWSEQ